MRYVRSFALFWWDFIVGDYWPATAAAVVAVVLTWWLERWWLLPVAVALVLVWSVWRDAARSS
jgi:hypothetical protein